MNVVSHEWTKQEHAYLRDLVEKSEKNEWGKFADDMTAQFGHEFTYEQVRSYWRTNIQHTPSAKQFEQVIEYKEDGSVYVEDLVEIYNERDKTPERILEMLGFKTDAWEAPNFKLAKWNQHNKEDGTVDLYSVKIDLKPKQKELTPEDMVEMVQTIEPKKIDLQIKEIPNQYLLINLYDPHFGLNSFEDYEQLQKDLADLILNGYAEILFILGGDFLHVSNFNNETEAGTRIDDTSVSDSVKWAIEFLYPLLELALEHCPNVKLTYLKGNHAPVPDYMFTLLVQQKYPDVEVDAEIKEYKHTWLGEHSIFSHHGNIRKTTNRLLDVIVSEFAQEWGQSQSRYLITGHFHHEKSLSTAGMTHYQVMSPSKQSSYDKQMGYVDSESGLMLFTFDEEKRRRVDYL